MQWQYLQPFEVFMGGLAAHETPIILFLSELCAIRPNSQHYSFYITYQSEVCYNGH